MSGNVDVSKALQSSRSWLMTGASASKASPQVTAPSHSHIVTPKDTSWLSDTRTTYENKARVTSREPTLVGSTKAKSYVGHDNVEHDCAQASSAGLESRRQKMRTAIELQRLRRQKEEAIEEEAEDELAQRKPSDITAANGAQPKTSIGHRLSLGDTSDIDIEAPPPVPLSIIKSKMDHNHATHRPVASPDIQPRAVGNHGVRDNETSVISWSVSEVNGTQHYDQDEAPRPVREVLHYVPEAYHGYLGDWLKDTQNEPTELFVLEGLPADAHHRDINTDTARLSSRIEYPEAYKQLPSGPCRDFSDIVWRQAHMTSELAIQREIRCRENIKATAAGLRALRPKKMAVEEAVQAPDEPTWPNAECTLRPATEDDFEEIAAIINMEAKQKAPQVFETKTVSVADVSRVQAYCASNLRPFIVAIPTEEDLTDRSKWPKNAEKAYQQFLKFKKTQPSSQRPPVVGFAFLSETMVGLLDYPCPGSRHAGQVRLIVHPSHRQAKIGTALLDRILLCMTPFYKSIIDYEWECSDPREIYEYPSARNRRQYSQVSVEFFATNNQDEGYKSRAHMLTKFGFKLAAFLPRAVRFGGRSLGQAIWKLEIQEAFPYQSNSMDQI